MRFPSALVRLLPLLILLFGATGAMVVGFLLGSRPRPVPAPHLDVAVVNVGQGEASWIRTPGGKFILIGGGPVGRESVVADSLRAAGASRIDLLVLPYPYEEAIGGVPELLRRFPVHAVLECGYPASPELTTLEEVRAQLIQSGVPVTVARAGQRLVLDGVRLEVLAPDEPPVAESPRPANNSLVLRARFGQTVLLWMGGVERAGENALLARAPDLSADWLRVSRFGTRQASSPELLRLVRPGFAVISVGAANPGGYPHIETLDRLAATGARVYRTDQARGRDLVFHSDGFRIEAPP